uniref:Uncharacterized protein n=1 Tax=Strongyloides papillosus TaxID=174720 RepID=A0A0N5C9M0_STREA
MPTIPLQDSGLFNPNYFLLYVILKMIKEINLDDANLLDDNSNDVAKPTDIVDTNPVEPTKGSKDKHPNLSDSPLSLEDFKESLNVNWKELFMGVIKLKIILTDSCEVFKRLEKPVTNMKTLQAIICMNKQGCKYYDSPLRKIFIRELSIVLDHENNNTYFADVGRTRKARKSNSHFHYFAKIYYRNENILIKLCSTELPSAIQEELKNLTSKNPKTTDE